MKKYLIGATIVLASGFLLAGCDSSTSEQTSTSSTTATSTSSQKEQITVTISIDNQGEETASKTIEVSEDTDLLTILEDNFTVETSDGFIESIDGVTQDTGAGLYWTFTINGDWGESSAAETFLAEGDKVIFSYGGV